MKELEKVFKALANKRRLAIIQFIKKSGEVKVGDVAAKIKLSFAATSRHLIVLYNADILEKEQRSLEMWYKLSPTMHSIAKQVANSIE